MSNSKTLVIMAGGLGSRFGGLKQVEPVDKDGNFIIDYSVFDSIIAGFTKVVFVIKRENYDIFKNSIGKRVSKKIKVEYAFQEMASFVPSGVDYSSRVKPWGTGHAVLCAKDYVDGDFAVVNADDFYGRDGFMVASKFFDENSDPNIYAVVCYKAGNTLTENGAVKRGVCDIKDGYFYGVKESNIERKNGEIFATEINTTNTIKIGEDTLVNMNLICFKRNYFDVLEKRFKDFVLDNKTDVSKDEFLLLNEVPYAMQTLGVKMKVLSTTAVWYGFTYREDKAGVVSAIDNLRRKGEYPESLWGE